jgi:hypothetical protein
MKGHPNPTVRTTADGEQVGPKMHSAVKLVASGPYPSKNQLAKSVGPNGSQDYGYRIVDRCLSKNLLKVHPSHDDATPNGMGAVVLTDKGARYLNATEDMSLSPDEYVAADAYRSDLK